MSEQTEEKTLRLHLQPGHAVSDHADFKRHAAEGWTCYDVYGQLDDNDERHVFIVRLRRTSPR